MTAALPAEVLDNCTADLAALNDERDHDYERNAAFQSFLEDSDDPRRETYYKAPCGCIRVLERMSDDGETSYREWSWTTTNCLGSY